MGAALDAAGVVADHVAAALVDERHAVEVPGQRLAQRVPPDREVRLPALDGFVPGQIPAQERGGVDAVLAVVRLVQPLVDPLVVVGLDGHGLHEVAARAAQEPGAVLDVPLDRCVPLYEGPVALDRLALLVVADPLVVQQIVEEPEAGAQRVDERAVELRRPPVVDVPAPGAERHGRVEIRALDVAEGDGLDAVAGGHALAAHDGVKVLEGTVWRRVDLAHERHAELVDLKDRRADDVVVDRLDAGLGVRVVGDRDGTRREQHRRVGRRRHGLGRHLRVREHCPAPAAVRVEVRQRRLGCWENIHICEEYNRAKVDRPLREVGLHLRRPGVLAVLVEPPLFRPRPVAHDAQVVGERRDVDLGAEVRGVGLEVPQERPVDLAVVLRGRQNDRASSAPAGGRGRRSGRCVDGPVRELVLQPAALAAGLRAEPLREEACRLGSELHDVRRDEPALGFFDGGSLAAGYACGGVAFAETGLDRLAVGAPSRPVDHCWHQSRFRRIGGVTPAFVMAAVNSSMWFSSSLIVSVWSSIVAFSEATSARMASICCIAATPWARCWSSASW